MISYYESNRRAGLRGGAEGEGRTPDVVAQRGEGPRRRGVLRPDGGRAGRRRLAARPGPVAVPQFPYPRPPLPPTRAGSVSDGRVSAPVRRLRFRLLSVAEGI